ncbi:6625_t:CDS:2 [Gigaspora margarita]|uniref:6625_t:CDS:1 n=1 Tax=Gigaspora margarita TaxID=4874 RepID=A0ABN7V2B2_GIGMA|nr:6625_t:CDS:2 [Gigaspora margarita]
MDQCQSCQMPEYVIYHECQAREMKYHLICSGCEKTCDGGIYKRDNDYYSFHHPKCGAYVFHINSVKKPEGEDFYLCVSCEEKHCQKYLNQCKSCQELFCSDCGEEDYCRDCQPDTTECLYCGKIVLTEETDSGYCLDCFNDSGQVLKAFYKHSQPDHSPQYFRAYFPLSEPSEPFNFQFTPAEEVEKKENECLSFKQEAGDHTVTELEERIELLDKQFNGVHPIYGEMNKLIGSLRKKVGEIENHILVSFQD